MYYGNAESKFNEINTKMNERKIIIIVAAAPHSFLYNFCTVVIESNFIHIFWLKLTTYHYYYYYYFYYLKKKVSMSIINYNNNKKVTKRHTEIIVFFF